MYQPKARWIEQGDSEFLMWGHIKVGEVTLGNSGWYAYFRDQSQSDRLRSLKDFPGIDLAKAAVEHALVRANAA